MGLDLQRNHDDPENGCRSLGSEFLPSGQSRKISIGILADESAQPRSAVRNTGKGALGLKLVEEKDKRLELTASLKGKQATDPGHKSSSPWISTRPFSQTMPPTSTVEVYAQRTSVLDTGDGTQKRFNRVNVTPKSEVVQLYAKQSLIYQSGSGVKKKTDGVAYGRRTEKEGNTERVEEFAFAAAQEVHVSDKGARQEDAEMKVPRSNEDLKQKLWEALETAPSQKEKPSDSTDDGKGSENSEQDKQYNRNSDEAVKPKPSADTIETDSGSPEKKIGRRVTRSLTRKKSSHQKLKQTINEERKYSPLSYRREHQEKNIFTFNEAEEQPGSLYQTANTYLPRKPERNNNKIDPRRLFFSAQRSSEKIRPGTNRGKKQVASKTPSHSSRVETSHSNPSENNKKSLQSGSEHGGHNHSSKSKNINQQEEGSSPELRKSASLKEGLCSGSTKKNADPQYGVESPSFGMKTTMRNPVLNSTSSRSIQKKNGVQSPAPDERIFRTKGLYNLRTPKETKQTSPAFSAQSDSSDDTQDCKESPIRESSPVLEEVDATHKSSQSSQDQEEENMDDDQRVGKGCRGRGMGPAVSDNPVKSLPVIRSNKRLRHDGLSSFVPSEKGSEELNQLLQHCDQNQDGLMRAVALFALALERFKTRIHTQTSKKSSEIMTSLAEEVQLQLQNVNSQIQKDISKFTNLSKAKRKSLETRFEEQQERLKSMQSKFREEVTQHLQECQSMIEDVEAFQIELKGDAKKQKTSHQKLLLQVEEAIGTQLQEADRKITSIHKVARSQMFQLKNVIAECLKEGVFS